MTNVSRETRLDMSRTVRTVLLLCLCIVPGCGKSQTPRELVEAYIQDEMLIRAGQYPGVKQKEGETFGEVVQWYEPKVIEPGRTIQVKVSDQNGQKELTLRSGTPLYRMVFTYHPPEVSRHNTRGWREKNSNHASRFQKDGKCDVVFVIQNGEVTWSLDPAVWD